MFMQWMNYVRFTATPAHLSSYWLQEWNYNTCRRNRATKRFSRISRCRNATVIGLSDEGLNAGCVVKATTESMTHKDMRRGTRD
jgi:hypothetical protein